MGKYIHWFDKITDFEKDYWDENYINPWVSYIEEDENIVYGPRDEEEAKWKNPLTFKILSSGTIGWKNNVRNVNYESCARTIQFSKNNGPWISITSTTDGVTIPVYSGDVLQFRGDNQYYGHQAVSSITYDIKPIIYFNYSYFTSTCDFNVSGNITSLLNSTNYEITTGSSQAKFVGLFNYCTGLIDASKLRLPLTTLKDCDYYGMFDGCTGLIHAPELPATSIWAWSYSYMFSNCTSLKIAPKINVTSTNNDHCAFFAMFKGCSSLEEIEGMPQLSGNIGSHCFLSMFEGCTSLTTTPNLSYSLSTSQQYQYARMFKGCTSLTTITNVPSETSLYSHQEMFMNCSSLTSAPSLSNSVLQSTCYKGMFQGCTSLTSAPSLPSMDLGMNCYESLFEGCSSLTALPSLPAIVLKSACYKNIFRGCTGLTSINITLPANTLVDSCYYGMFDGCTGLTEIPSNLFSTTTLADYCYAYMFENCTSLTTLPANLLSVDTLAIRCYSYMFKGCTSLVSVPSNFLPATTLANNCYEYMFSNCSNLEDAPELLYTGALPVSAYRYMFYACSKLNYVKVLASNISASSCTYYWLSQVANTGVLYTVNPSMWSRGTSGIPSNWTFEAPSGTLLLDTSPIDLKYWGDSKTISGWTNTDFTIINNNNWLTVTKEVNLQNNTYNIILSVDPCSQDRNGTIQIVNNYNNESYNITISQPAYSGGNGTYTIDLNNNEWVIDSNQIGDKNEVVYKSDSSYTIANGVSKAYITINGYTEFTLRVRTYGQGGYDYLVVSELDATPTKSSSVGGTSGNKWSGYNKYSATTWYDVTYTNIDGGQHVITLMYSKNASTNNYDDRAYFYIPRKMNSMSFSVTPDAQTIHLSGVAQSGWTITQETVDWTTITTSSGNAGFFDISIQVSENTTDVARSKTLTFNDGSDSCTISIWQYSSFFRNYNKVENIVLSENEYIDIGILNPTGLSKDNGGIWYGEFFISFTDNSILTDKSLFTINDNIDFKVYQNYLYSYNNSTLQETRYTSNGTSTSSSTPVIAIHNNASDFYSNGVWWEAGSNYSHYKYNTAVDSPRIVNHETDYIKFGKKSSVYNKLDAGIKNIKFRPANGSYVDGVYAYLYPWINSVTGQKLFATDDGSVIKYVRTDEN